jgi:hypothetical protein
MQLTSKKLYPSVPQLQVPLPVIPVDFVKPLSYEFRVAEIINDEGKIETVKLQMQIWEHDEFGSGTVKQYWSDVPRQKFDKNGVLLMP